MCRVMLVDDEPMIRDLYSEMLAIGGHEIVATADDGVQAVQKFEGMVLPPDIILMDHRMPHKSGLEATREIVDAHPGARVLMVTADFTVLPLAETEGACGVLEKPFSMHVLLDTIDQVLAGPAGHVAA